MATKQSTTTTTNGQVSAEDLAESVPQPITVPVRTADKIWDVVQEIARLERERNTMIEIVRDTLDVPDGWQLMKLPDGSLAFVAG